MSRLSLALSAIIAFFSAGAVDVTPAPVAIEDDDDRRARPRSMFGGSAAERLEHARGRVEAHIARKSVRPEEADALRERFRALLDAKLDAASQEGEVSDREASELRALARELLGRRG